MKKLKLIMTAYALLGGISLASAQTDVTATYITNAGFETAPIFDGTSVGSNEEPKSNAEPTAGATLVEGAVNVYEISGWTNMTDETSDFARVFTMPYNTTLYVKSNGSNGGQVVTSPTNGSSVTTGNNSLLFVEANWCNNAILGVKQTVNLPAGSYRLTFDTYVKTSVANASSRCGVSYGETTNYKWPEATDTWTNNEVVFKLTEPTDVTISMGYKKSANVGGGSSAFLFVDNVKLYYESLLDVAKKELSDRIVTAKAITAVHEASLQSALSSAISTAEAFSATTAAEYESAIGALQEAIDNSNTSISHYQNDLKPIIDKLKGYATTDLSAMDNDYNNGVYTSETNKAALLSQYQSIEIAALTAANATDYTSVIINPDFEFDGEQVSKPTKPTGWSSTHDGADDGTRNSTVTNMTGWYYNKWEQWWDENLDIKQKIANLPNGQYTISATLAGWSGCTVDLTANNKKTYINGAGDGTGVDASVTCNVTDGTLNIRVNWGVREGGTFFKCDNFTLTYHGVKPMLAEAITEAEAIYNNGANVGSGVFQIPAAAGTAFSNAISTAQGVYDNSGASASDVQTAIQNLEGAVTTFLETEINAPAEGQLFNIILTYSGWDYDQKAMTYMAGDRDDMGNYNIKYQAEANKNMAQAFTFTKVSGNDYRLSQIDTDGNARYMCTGKIYSGNNSQIRTTTNAEEAMAVTVIPTSVEGVYNLYNVAAENFIGSQDAGVFTVNSHISFNIVETTKPSIAINTTDAGYGTTMLPFAVAALPSGVKAYTCAEVEGATLTLAEVTALAANKPYIIEGAWNETVTGDAQGTALTYTEGLLTGVYADTAAPVGSYVLQNLDSGLGFYQVAEDKQPTVKANHAYLTLPVQEQTEARALFFDNATAIRAIEALTSGEAEIYNAAGARQNSLQKGVNIIKQGNKKFKVMVK